MAKLYLASKSPRRRELLGQIGIEPGLVDVEVDETPEQDESAVRLVERLALSKARAGWAALVAQGQITLASGDCDDERRALVFGADTVVVVDEVVLGKPGNANRAAEMLRRLSGRSHEVLTACALVGNGYEGWRLSASTVTFREISPAEIEAYAAKLEPLDKAGGYAIQGLAAIFATELRGSYSGVMGLALHDVAYLLAQAGVDVFKFD